MIAPSIPLFPLNDVRAEADFEPSLYPKADGAFLTEEGDDEVLSSRKRCFLSLYYRLNRSYSALADARNLGIEALVASLLNEIQVDYDMRQALENHYAPIGFIGEPEMDGVLTTNVVFSHSRLGPERESLPIVLSSSIKIALPADIQAELER